MSRWTSKWAILRDLSLAQGGLASPEARPIAAAERPPRLSVHEETEEEYFEHCVGDGNLVDKPDLGLIQQMLDMVRDFNETEDEVKTSDVAVISKLNPTSAVFVPRQVKPQAKVKSPQQPVEVTPNPNNVPNSNIVPNPNNVPNPDNVPLTKNDSQKIPKRIRQRNIALESIFAMENKEPNNNIECNEPMKLLKPEDLIPKHDTNVDKEVVEKVNDWMEQMTSPIKNRPVSVILDGTNMFKKKEIPKPCVNTHPSTMFKKKENSKPCLNMNPSSMFKNKAGGKSKEMKPSSCSSNGAYIPSTQAGQYYQQYLEKSKLMDALNDDIWTKAEKKMQQIDEKKRLEAAQRAKDEDAEKQTVSSASVASELTKDESVSNKNDPWRHARLNKHRHLQLQPQPESSCRECQVCACARRACRLTQPLLDFFDAPLTVTLTVTSDEEDLAGLRRVAPIVDLSIEPESSE